MPYLTVTEYMRRCGEREAIILTNETPRSEGPGAPDTAKIENAISDAGEIIDGYISRRYTVPLATVPPVVVGWTYALAREILHTGHPMPDEVADKAARVLSQIKDVAAERMNLNVPATADPLGTVSVTSGATSGDRDCPVFTDEALSDYFAPFTGGCRTARWRSGC